MARKPKNESAIQNQRVRSRDKKKSRLPDYQEWRNENQRYDVTGQADPDVLGDKFDEPLSQIEREEMENEVRNKANKVKLMAKQVLTEKEFAVFDLLAVKGVSFQTAAAILTKRYGSPVSKSLVQGTWERAREKLQNGIY